MNLKRLILPAVLAVLVAVVLMLPPRLKTTVTIASICGVYAVFAVSTNGDLQVYDASNPPPDDVIESILKLEKAQKHMLIVPCMMENGTDIQAKNGR